MCYVWFFALLFFLHEVYLLYPQHFRSIFFFPLHPRFIASFSFSPKTHQAEQRKYRKKKFFFVPVLLFFTLTYKFMTLCWKMLLFLCRCLAMYRDDDGKFIRELMAFFSFSTNTTKAPHDITFLPSSRRKINFKSWKYPHTQPHWKHVLFRIRVFPTQFKSRVGSFSTFSTPFVHYVHPSPQQHDSLECLCTDDLDS